MGFMEAYSHKADCLRQQPSIRKRVMEDVGKIQVPTQDGLARGIELVSFEISVGGLNDTDVQ